MNSSYFTLHHLFYFHFIVFAKDIFLKGGECSLAWKTRRHLSWRMRVTLSSSFLVVGAASSD